MKRVNSCIIIIKNDEMGEKMQQETDLKKIRAMEQRYEFENRMMDAISHGDFRIAENMTLAFSTSAFEERTADPLRNLQNYCIIMNTLCRKAAETGGVHPVFLNDVSSSFARRIEQLRNVAVIPSFMQEMMASYCRLVQTHSIKSYSPTVQKAVLYIESNLQNELGLSSVAEAISVSAGYLSSVFKKETGQTLTAYVNAKRIEQAKHLLRATDLQIQTVAQDCGFLDLHYFCRVFKAHTGTTPSAYRKAN